MYMKILLVGVLMALVGLIIALIIGNMVILVLLHDLPWLRLFRQQHDVEMFKNLSYVPGSVHPKHRLDLYRPKGKKGYPVVVFFHGGYWTTGDKDYYQAFTGLYANVGVALARNGIGVAIANYRLAPAVAFESIIGDAAAAVAWTQKHVADFDGDPASMFVMGHSAGGHIAALLAAEPNLLKDAGVPLDHMKGFIALSAIYDLADMASANDASFNATVTKPVFGSAPDALTKWSPIAHFRLGTPPLLMLTGEKDFAYLLPQAERAQRTLEELHAQPVAFRIPGYSHMDMVMKFGRDKDETLRRVLDFTSGGGSGVSRR
ncbi:MAG TPA: alpha/beta hydrolase [Candidatus Binatia bacterium]|jgi:acetyl esterase/lipase|nr:alpha/beta hydrolase [Candidatus Binatia bacterium]